MADSGGRVSMPFLPTLVTVVILAAASVVCTKHQTPAPAVAARMLPATGAPSLAIAEPAAPASGPSASAPFARPPAVIAFSEVFPLTADPATTSALSVAAPARTAAVAPAPRPLRRLAAANRRPCPTPAPGRRCQDAPQPDNPFLPARPASDTPGATAQQSPPATVPSALPFAESVAEAVVPVAREVGAGIGARVERITGGASDLVRGGQAVVKGSVSILADRLL
ncbi:hypothetical protein [Methylobacterium sp. J-076]|uniref:hypothetical protein n=1 Tax=Methylobacterium sp. J-076 TaxID=2836655 RepID=UPI001FB99307|nr:hypothetical protein [Methylobacterium sp. J-076]MCJ2013511.1 hypothetical protein [Methylobacterium sp. J-076]